MTKGYILVIVLLLSGSAFAEEQTGTDKLTLAIVMQYDRIGKDLPNDLQPLLEAETVSQWPGRLVERAELNKLLEELKISVSGLADQNNCLKLGKMIKMDCLLTARVSTESVQMTVSLFPSTVIIYERTYRQRLEPHSLAVNMVTDAVKALREHTRDPNMPQISIGSFFNSDPHRRFFTFSQDIAAKLRQQLANNKDVLITERLFPSDLLGEFELARGGFTEQIERCLSAPPSDILLYGEFEPRPEQDLQSKNVILDHTLFVVSPTGVCKNRRVKLSCLSSEPNIVAAQALKLIEQTTAEVRTNLALGKKRTFSEEEFKSFKKQAFRLMPNPPPKDGNFYKEGSYVGPDQIGFPIAELERSLRMLECAMLFKGNDTQVLVCTGAIFDGLANDPTYPQSVKEKFLETSFNMIERAYYLDSNWNTRGMYFQFCMRQRLSPPDLSPNSIKAARQIWNTRQTEPWQEHEIYAALVRLLAGEKDYARQCQMFIEAGPEYEKKHDRLGELFGLFGTFRNQLNTEESNPQIIQQTLGFAERLQDDQSLFLQALGHMLYLEVYWTMEESEKNSKFASEFAQHLRKMVDMLPELNKVYGEKFVNSGYSGYFHGFFEKYQVLVKRYNLKNDVVELKATYAEAQIRGGNYNEVSQTVGELLPSMWENGQYEHAYKLLTEFLEHYAVGGAGDSERMSLTSQRNRFFYSMQRKTFPLGLNQLEKIEFDDNVAGWITKVIASKKNVFGVRSSEWNRNGRAFQFTYGEHQAKILKAISDNVCDFACTNKFIGIATERKGFYMLNRGTLEMNQFTPQNSNLPGKRVTLVCDNNTNFLIGIPDKENYYTLIYRLDPEAGKISSTATKFSANYYWQIKPNDLGEDWQFPPNGLEEEKLVVIPQTWYKRTAHANGKILQFACTPEFGAIKDVTVKIAEEGELLRYRGFELSYVYDFILWHGELIFATGNGLYISKTGSNKIQCIICEPNLQFFSLCLLDDRIYFGTNQGLYCIKAKSLIETVKKVE